MNCDIGYPESVQLKNGRELTVYHFNLFRLFSRATLLGSVILILQAEDQDAQWHARQSYDHLRQGQLAEAEQEIRESIRLSPTDPLYHSALAGILHRSHRLKECATEYSKALDSLAENSAARQKVAEQLEAVDLESGAECAKTARYNEGLGLSADAAQRFPASARVFQMLGYFQTKVQLNVAAVKSYRRALDLNPASADACLGLAMAQSAAGMNKDAVATLESNVKRFPDNALIFQTLGVVLLQAAEPERAAAMFDAALKIDGVLAESHLQLGNMALDKRDLTRAGQHLLAAEAAAPQDSRIHFALARWYRRTGDTEAASREMKAFEVAKTVATR
jgi:protein O-GlcNAc transferase